MPYPPTFNRYYDDDGYDRRSIQRSLSQPSLARSGAEIIEQHWIIRDDVSDDSNPSENPNRLVRFMRSIDRIGI